MARRTLPRLSEACAAAPHVFVVTDFDGTLARLGPRARDVRMPSRRRALLSRLARGRGAAVLILSGRRRAEVSERASVPEAEIWGEHGADRGRGRRGSGTDVRRWLSRLARILPNGTAVERKRECLAFHLRKVRARDRARLRRDLESFAREEGGGLRVLGGTMRLELQPARAHKGRAAVAWLRERGFRPGSDVCVVIGDSETDEEAFRTLRRRAWTFRVGAGATRASERLPRLRDVDSLLATILRARGA